MRVLSFCSEEDWRRWRQRTKESGKPGDVSRHSTRARVSPISYVPWMKIATLFAAERPGRSLRT
jgi:hypothetical protein